MAGRKKVPSELLAEREMAAWQLRVSNPRVMTHERIKEELNKHYPNNRITRQAVTKMLARIERRYRENHAEMIDSLKMRQYALLENIVDEALSAWERSTQASKMAKRKGNNTVEQTVKDQDGDPRFLAAAMSALEDIRRLFGVEEPAKLEHSGPGGGPIPFFDMDEWKRTRSQRLKSVAALQD